MNTSRIPRVPGRHRRGSVAVIYALVLIPIIGFAGLALDLSFAYTRRTEMQSVADAAAMAAARALNGTVAGIANAQTEARLIAQRNKYSFGRAVVWNDAALRFSDSPEKPDGDWLPAASISAANATSMYYAKVDTVELGDSHSSVNVVFARILGIAQQTIEVTARAIAGRTSIQVTPLAVCAINNTRVSQRAVNEGGTVKQELLHHGFRRGVSYNLLNMNPNGTTAVSYLVNPLDFSNQPEHPNHRSLAVVRPFVCSGSIAASNLRFGARVYVGTPFPPELIPELNSRFGFYIGSTCNEVPAPPDDNIKEFNVHYFGRWLNTTATVNGSAEPHVFGVDKLLTVADETVAVAGITKTHYGPLWAYSKAVYYDSGAPDGVGAPFLKDKWLYLYPVGSGGAIISTYNDTYASPYNASVSPHLAFPPTTSLPKRRVLNIPLLECPVPSGSARVLAIGRFFMGSRADAAMPAVHGEFGGLLPDDELAATVGLYK